MILLLSEKNNSFESFFEKKLNLPYLECPNCKSSKVIKWGFYVRNINYINNNKYEYKIIKIQRIKCKECGSTHALLPIFIVPYKINSIEIIVNSLNNKEINLNISVDTINHWNKIFNKYIPYLKTMLNNISKKEILIKLKENIIDYINEFYYKYKKILMMSHKGLFNIQKN